MDALLEVGTSFNSLVALYEGNSDYRQEVPFFKELLYKDEQTYGPDLWFAKTLHAPHYNDFFLLGVTPSAWIAG
jgi:hypothetical protein